MSGMVRDALTQEPISGASIVVCGYGEGNANQYPYELRGQGEAITDETGYFTIGNLPTETNRGPLTYSAIISPTNSSRPTYEIRPITGLTITLNTQLNVDLKPGATLRGNVSDEHSGAPLFGVKVYAHFQAPPATLYSRRLLLSTETDASGYYTLTNLSTTSYGLSFEPPDPAYVWEMYPDLPNYTKETPPLYLTYPIRITAGTATNGIDATLRQYSLISGTVSIAATGQPISGTEVSLTNLDIGFITPLPNLTYITDEDGYYTALVPEGSYLAFFKPPASSGYPCQYYYDYERPDEYPLEFQVNQPELLTISAPLREPGKITGRVRYPSGQGIPTATIQESILPDPECNFFNSPYSVQPDGSFELNNLVPRRYKWLGASLNNQSHYFYQTHDITVREGEVVSGVEFIFPEPIFLPLVGRR